MNTIVRQHRTTYRFDIYSKYKFKLHFMTKPEQVQNGIATLLNEGWKIEPTSCACGGRFAWLFPHESGAMEMFGCVCHKTIVAIEFYLGAEKKE